MLKKSLCAIFCTALSSLAIATNVNALSFTESPDAGEFLGTAGQTNTQPTGTTLDTISGILANTPNGDIDLFQILSPGGSFSATTDTASTDPGLDTQLFLFDANGYGIAASNDIGSLNFYSTISLNLSAGIYYVAISSFGSDPQSAGGDIFNIPTTGQVNPANGSGAASPLSSWSANSVPGTGAYNIGVTGAQFVGSAEAVPFEVNPLIVFLIFGAWRGTIHFKRKKPNICN